MEDCGEGPYFGGSYATKVAIKDEIHGLAKISEETLCNDNSPRDAKEEKVNQEGGVENKPEEVAEFNIETEGDE